jgi:hypothetical protein
MHRSVRETSRKQRADNCPRIFAVAVLQKPAPDCQVDLVLVHRNGEPADVLADIISV